MRSTGMPLSTELGDSQARILDIFDQALGSDRSTRY